MSIDRFLAAEYDAQRYTCLHFASDVWQSLTGSPLDKRLYSFLSGYPDGSARHVFKRLNSPASPCIVLFRGPGESHVGVFMRGRVLHLTECGARFQPLHDALIGFRDARFYTC